MSALRWSQGGEDGVELGGEGGGEDELPVALRVVEVQGVGVEEEAVKAVAAAHEAVER